MRVLLTGGDEFQTTFFGRYEKMTESELTFLSTIAISLTICDKLYTIFTVNLQRSRFEEHDMIRLIQKCRYLAKEALLIRSDIFDVEVQLSQPSCPNIETSIWTFFKHHLCWIAIAAV